MPNKRRIAKMQTKLLASGKLKSTAKAQNVLKYLAEKAAIDNEDVDYDYDLDKNNDFEKLADDTPDKKAKNGKKPGGIKRNKQPADDSAAANKKAKVDAKEAKPAGKKADAVIPKKSKKNKYFFMAHPEALAKKDEIIQSASNLKSEFVIDEEKLKLIEQEKKKKKTTNGSAANGKKADKKGKKSQDKKGNGRKEHSKLFKNNNLWQFEPCSSSEDESDVKQTEGDLLDIDNIDKGFEIKKFVEKFEDGTLIEVFKPVPVVNDNSKHTKRNGVEEDEDDDDEAPEAEMSDDDEDVPAELDESEDDDEDDEDEDEEDEDEEDQAEDDETKDEKPQEKKENGNSAPAVRNLMLEKLKASRFRYLNELLYTQPSDKSFELFEKDVDSFKAYHEGFKNQVEKWPINPLDEIIKFIKKRPNNQVVADFGCGEARLARSVNNKVHSFDLVPLNELVTKCDMKKVPLNSESVDIAVFCLSLMGTNLTDFVCEAHRVLKPNGLLKIAEVVSRITDRQKFIQDIEAIGFKLTRNKDKAKDKAEKDKTENGSKYFYFFDFVKSSPKIKSRPVIKLSPCLYKKR